MASALSAIGAAAVSLKRQLPGALRGGAHELGEGLAFAGQLGQSMQSGNMLAEIAAMLNTGTPIANIIQHVAAGNSAVQTRLQRALSSALAPPGTSPPESGPDKAALLRQRLSEMVSKLSGGTTTKAGQQNEFPGNVLDAESAKESPAQQVKNPAASAVHAPSADLISFIESLLNSAAASVAGSAPANIQTPTGSSDQVQAQAPADGAQSQTRTAPDILTRMLTRAANADAQRNGETVAQKTPSTSAPSGTGASSSTSQSNAALFDRLVSAIADQAASAANGSSGKAQDGQTAAGSTVQTGSNSAVPLAASGATAAQNAQTQPSSQPLTPYTTVDPSAVIEQVVKGIAMTTTANGSQLHLRLQPEQLGDVSLKLTVVGNTITANVVAQNADVRDMLLSNQQHLVRSLAEAGLALGKFSVNVSGGQAGFTQQQSQQRAHTGRSISAGGSLLSNESSTWEDERFGPPISNGTGSIVFSYLA